MNTLVVNCYAGPGAGKTTCAWEVAAELKKKGINCEYVPEYPKELVWEGKLDLLKNQEHIFEEQAKRLGRLRGKVEVIVTDSPILMNHIYGENNSEAFTKAINAEYKKYYNFNLFIQRDKSHFQQEGRIQNLEESIKLDRKIKKILKENNIFYGTYRHENVKYIADNIIRNLDKIRNSPEIDIKAIPSLSDAEVYDKLYGKEINAGYYITDQISFNGGTFVLGYNPNAPEPYVTWEKNGDSYEQGNYYIDKQSAVQNLLERSTIMENIHQKSEVAADEAANKDYSLPEDFDKEAFINGIETAIDYGSPISQAEYDLYQRLTLTDECAAEEAEDMDFDDAVEM